MNKLDLLEDKKRRALAHWQLHQQAVEEVRLKLAIVQAQAQRAYEELRSINDMINLIQGRKILAQQRIKIGRTLYTGSTVDVATAKELMGLGINVAGIKALIKTGELKLQRAATTSCKCN